MNNIKRKIRKTTINFLGWFTVILISPCILPIQIIVAFFLISFTSIHPLWCLMAYPVAIIWGFISLSWMDEFYSLNKGKELNFDDDLIDTREVKSKLNEKELDKILERLR